MIEDLHKQRAALNDTTHGEGLRPSAAGVVSSGPGEAHPPGQSGEPPAETSLPAMFPVPVVSETQRIRLRRAIASYRSES